MNFIELLEKRGVSLDDVSFIAVYRQGIMVSTISKELFPYLDYDVRIMELSLWSTDFKKRLYWIVDEISITKKVKLSKDSKEE